MDRRIVKLSCDPFSVDAGKGRGWYFVNPDNGDVLFGSAVMRASKGLTFSLIPEPAGRLLRLQYVDIIIDIGWTDDAADATSWVEAVNRFLETKRGAADANGQPMPPTSAESTVG